jgi:hypothetical protein
MFRTIKAVALFLLIAAPVAAQTPIVIGPNSLLLWEMPGLTVPVATACTYAVSAAGGPFTPLVGKVTCSPPDAPATSVLCSVNLIAQTVITIGSGSITLVATCDGQTSLPSVPFAYLDLAVPVPQNVRFK